MSRRVLPDKGNALAAFCSEEGKGRIHRSEVGSVHHFTPSPLLRDQTCREKRTYVMSKRREGQLSVFRDFSHYKAILACAYQETVHVEAGFMSKGSQCACGGP